jgi:ABC-type cobalamin/Fe3+-siderophores transport system ATPase subunit
VGIERRDWEVVIRYLKKTGILHLRNRPFRSISGGERQRALVARALSGEPDVLILDEPTASVDVRGEAEIMGLLEEIRESRAITVLIVTHFLHTIARFADHVVFIDKDRGAFLTGKKEEVLTDSVLGDVFGLDVTVKSRM